MRIDRLELENFRCFTKQTLELHEHFTLLVGDNGTGKTAFLDALAVAAGVWLIKKPDTILANSGRGISPGEVRVELVMEGDRRRFVEHRPVKVCVTGELCGEGDVTWTRQIHAEGKRTSNIEAKEAQALIDRHYEAVIKNGEKRLSPVIAYYGAGRRWMAASKREDKRPREARRWDAFYDCLNERIRLSDIMDWFRREHMESANRRGEFRPGHEVAKRAVLGCIPEADDLWFDSDREEVVLSIHGNAQPFSNLSAGQGMMLALVADIAIKAVTQNAFLLPPDKLGPEDKPVSRLLQKTPGLILIDELDVHLHPKWQRRVATDLKRTFPAMQFVCTSHSPQVIGEVMPEEVRLLPEHPDGKVEKPGMSYGADSNWVLKVLMEAAAQDPKVTEDLAEISNLISARRLDEAQGLVRRLRGEVGNTESIQKAASTIDRVRLLGK